MMIDKDVLLTILSAFLSVVVTIITTYVIPWIKAKSNATQLEQIDHYVKMAVRTAEQIYTPEEWAQKKEFVMNYIIRLVNDKFSINLSTEDINCLVEGVVNEVKKR